MDGPATVIFFWPGTRRKQVDTGDQRETPRGKISAELRQWQGKTFDVRISIQTRIIRRVREQAVVWKSG